MGVFERDSRVLEVRNSRVLEGRKSCADAEDVEGGKMTFSGCWRQSPSAHDVSAFGLEQVALSSMSDWRTRSSGTVELVDV